MAIPFCQGGFDLGRQGCHQAVHLRVILSKRPHTLTGEARVSYLAEASTCRPALVTGLGGYVLVDGAETLAGTSTASAIQGANLKTGAVVCDGTSEITGDAQSLLARASEADGSCDAQADTQVVFEVDGVVLAGDGFDGNGNPLPSRTAAVAMATTHAEAGASGGSR